MMMMIIIIIIIITIMEAVRYSKILASSYQFIWCQNPYFSGN